MGHNSLLYSGGKKVDKEKLQFCQESITLELLRLEDALSAMEEGSHPPPIELFLSGMFKCKQDRSLADARHLLMILQKCGLETHRTLGNFIVPLLIEVGTLCDAQRVFNQLATRNDYSWNSLISGVVKYGDPSHALTIYTRMHEDHVKPTGFTFVALLRACAVLDNLTKGQELHYEIARLGLERALFVGSSLVDMYMNCGLFAKAVEVFNKLREKDAVSWNALIAGFCKLGLYCEALNWYERMQLEVIVPTTVTFIFLFKAFSGVEAIDSGLELHAEIVAKGVLETDREVGNELIEMYANCGFFGEAEKVCEKIVSRDTFSWTALVAGYCKHKLFQEALSCFKQMQMEGIAPGSVTFVNILKACASMTFGQEVHSDIVKRGLLKNNLVNTALIDMYGNAGLVAEAQHMFDDLPVRDLVSWTALIAGYSRHGHIKEAADCFLEMEQQNVIPDLMSWNALIEGFTKNGHGEDVLGCLEQMQSKGIYPDPVTYLFSLKACGSIVAKSKGRELHIDITKKGLAESVSAIGNALVDFYATTGLLEEAQDVFHKLSVLDVVSWTSLMAGYARYGLGHEALNLFDQMQLLGVLPSSATYVCSLKACALTKAAVKGEEFHADIEKKGLVALDVVGNALMNMYASCGLLAEAQKVFERLPVTGRIAWTALITGYAKHGESKEALSCFEAMKSKGILPDVVTWSALIAGYASHNCAEEALKCLREMKHAGICPDAVAFVSSLKACGTIRAVDAGQKLHAEIEQAGLTQKEVVGNALVDMYATCGLLLEARDVFDKLLVRDSVSWTSLIAGYAKHGFGEEALHCFKQMQSESLPPDAATFICSLKACGIAGAANMGQKIHETITSSGLLGTNPLLATALLNMYIDCGLLAKASEVFNQLLPQNDVAWTTMISGYAKYGCIEEALECFRRMQVAGVSPNTSTWNALLSGYACVGKCENLFDAVQSMRIGGVDLNVDTLTGVLTACSHAGLVDLGQSYFRDASKNPSITPIVEHHVCMVDLLGRAGQLHSAVAFINYMPYHPTLVIWHAILGACRKWSDAEIAKQAFEQAVQLDVKDAGTYVCMFNICANAMARGKNIVGL